MITCRPGGYKWFLLMEKIKKQERYRIERQRIIDEIEKAKQHIATIKIVSPSPQSIRYNN
jgi:intein-encoded DNA endonuclease-like protein